MATVDRQKNRVLEIKEHQRLVDTGLLGSPQAPRRIAFADLKAKLANPLKTESESYFGEEWHPTQYEVDNSWIHSLRAYQEETPLTPRASPWIEPFVPPEFPDETHALLRSPPPEVIRSPKLPFGRPALGSQLDLTLGQPALDDAFSDLSSLPSWARVRNSTNPSSGEPSRPRSREEIRITPQILDSGAVPPINDGAKPLEPVAVGRGLSSNNKNAHNEKQVLKLDTPRSTKKHMHGADFRRQIPMFRQALKSGRGNSNEGSTSRDIPHRKHSQPSKKKFPNCKTLKSREPPVLGDNGQDCQLVTVNQSSEDLSQAIYKRNSLSPVSELFHYSIDNLHEEFTLFNNHAFRPWHEAQERQNHTDTAHVLHHVHGVPITSQKHCSIARGELQPNNSKYNQTTLRRHELIPEFQEHLQVRDQSLPDWRVPIANSLSQGGCLQETYSALCQENDCNGAQADPEKEVYCCEAGNSGYYQFDSSKREKEARVSLSPRSHAGRSVKSKMFDCKKFSAGSSLYNLADKTEHWSSSPFHLADEIERRPREWTYPSEVGLSCYDRELSIEDPDCSYSSWPSSAELSLDPNFPLKSKRESRPICNHSVFILPHELQRYCSSGSIPKSTSSGSLEAGNKIQDPILSTKAEREQERSQSLVRQDGPDPDILRSRILLASYNKVQSEASNSKSCYKLNRYCKSPFVNVLTPLELDSLASSKSSKPSAAEHQFKDDLPNEVFSDYSKFSAPHNQQENAILEFYLGGFSKELQTKCSNHTHRNPSPPQTVCPSQDSHNTSKPMSEFSRNIEDSPFLQSPKSVVFENQGSVFSTGLQVSSTPSSYFEKRPTPLHVSSRKLMKRKPLSESYDMQGEEVQRKHRYKCTFSQAAGHLVDLGSCEKRIEASSRKRYSDPGQNDDDLGLSLDSEKTSQSSISHHLNFNSKLTSILPAPSPSICSVTSISSHEEDGIEEMISKKPAKDHPHIPSVLDSRASNRMSTLPIGRMSEEEPLQKFSRTPEYQCQSGNQNKLRVTLKGRSPKFPKYIVDSRNCETPSRAHRRFQVQADHRDQEKEVQRRRRLLFKKHAGSTTKCKNKGIASFRKGLIDQKITDNLENISPPMDMGYPSPSSRKSMHNVRILQDNKENVTTQVAPKIYSSAKCTESRIRGKETPSLTSRKSKNISFSKDQDSQLVYMNTSKSSRKTGRTTLMREHQEPTEVKDILLSQTVPQYRRKGENKLDPGRHMKAISEGPKAYKGEITMMEQHSQSSINHLDYRQQKSPPKKAHVVKPRLLTPPRSYLQNFLLRSDVIEEQEDVDQHLQGLHGASKSYKETSPEASRPVFPSASSTGYILKSTSDCHCFNTERKLKPRNKVQFHPSTEPPIRGNLCICTSTPFPQSGLGRPPKFNSNMSRKLSERTQTCCIHDDPTEGFKTTSQRFSALAIKTSDKVDILGRTVNFTSQVPVPVLQIGEEEAREQKISKETVVSKECGITTSEGFLIALHKERLHRATSVTSSEPSDPILELNRQYQALQEFIDIIFQSLNSTPKGHALPSLRELKVKQVNLVPEIEGRAVTLIDMPGTNLQVPNKSLKLEAEKKKSIVELEQCSEPTNMVLKSPSRAKITGSRPKPLAKRPKIHPGSEHLPEKLTADTEKVYTKCNALPGSVMLGSVPGGTNATPLESHPKRVKSWPEGNKGKKQKFASSLGKFAYSIKPSNKEPKPPRKARLDQSLPKGFTNITLLPPTSEENHTKPPWCKFYRMMPKNGVVSCLVSDCHNEKQGTLQSISCSTSLRLRQPNLEITQFDDPDIRLKMPIIGSLTKTASPQRQLGTFNTNPLSNSLKLRSKLSPCLLQRDPLLDSDLSEILRIQKAYWTMALLGSEKLKSGTTMQAVDAGTSDESSIVTTMQPVPDHDQKVKLCILEEAIRFDCVYKAHASSIRAKNLTPSSSNNVAEVQEQGNKMGQDLEQRKVVLAQDAEQGNSTVQDPEQAEVDHTGTSNTIIKAAESHNLTSQIFLNIHFSSPKQHTEKSAADNATENSINTKSLLNFHSYPPKLRYHASANHLQSRSGSGRQLNNDYQYDGQTKTQPSSQSFTLADDSPSHTIQVLPECAEDGEQTPAVLYPCEYSTTRNNSQSDIFHNARNGTLAVKNSSIAIDSVPYLSPGHASVNTHFLLPNSVKIKEICSSDIRAQTSPLDRHYSWMPSSSAITEINSSKQISKVAADNQLSYDHNWRTPCTCDSDVKDAKSVTSDHDEQRSAYDLPLANASPCERSWRTTGTSTTYSQQADQSGYVYHGGLKPSYYCNTPAAGKPSDTTNWPNLLPVCRTCSPCKEYSITTFHTASNQTSLPCSITWNGNPNMPLMVSASSTLQHIQATPRPGSIPSEHSIMSSGYAVTSMSSNEGSTSLEKPGFMPVKADCSTPTMDTSSIVSMVHTNRPAEHVARMEDFRESQTPTRSEASSYVGETRRKQLGEVVLYFSPRAGDLMIVRRRRHQQLKDNGYVSFYTRDHDSYPWNTGDFVLNIGKFVSGNSWQMSSTAKLFQRTHDRLWMSVGLLEKPDRMFSWVKRNMVVDKHCRFFVPRRGDLIVKLQALESPSQLERWSFKTRINIGDILVRAFIGNLGFEEPKEEVEGHAEIYVYGGKDSSWTFMGRDDCLYKDGFDLLERGSNRF